jgi:hypothetical protein
LPAPDTPLERVKALWELEEVCRRLAMNASDQVWIVFMQAMQEAIRHATETETTTHEELPPPVMRKIRL